MKVLRINTEFNRGGAALTAQMLHKTSNYFNKGESFFAYGRGSKSGDVDEIRFTIQAEVYLHVLFTRISGLQGYGTWFSTKKLLNLINKVNPDVIHFHNIHGYYLDLSIASMVGKLGIPIVWTLHDGWVLTGRCCYLRGCERWLDGCGKCPNKEYYPRTWLDSSRFMWKNKRKLLGEVWTPTIVTPSKWLADKVYLATNGECVAKIIPNGIDTTIFRPVDKIVSRTELGLPIDKKIILFIASNLKVKEKGAKLFFESLKFIDGKNYLVVTAGERIESKEFCNLNIPIKHLGYINGSEKLRYLYNSGDIFCITSLEENFPGVVLQSMSC